MRSPLYCRQVFKTPPLPPVLLRLPLLLAVKATPMARAPRPRCAAASAGVEEGVVRTTETMDHRTGMAAVKLQEPRRRRVGCQSRALVGGAGPAVRAALPPRQERHRHPHLPLWPEMERCGVLHGCESCSAFQRR